ncbi:MAG: hypothetical protein QOH05_4101, partial [Acetobacteraceae bacterium]|nr:hypothetical protein [Acetobacteraceae bacterium]
MPVLKRLGTLAAVAGLAAIGVAAAPHDANAWWRGGWGVGIYVPPVVVGPPVYAPPVYVAPPVAYVPPPPAPAPPPPVEDKVSWWVWALLILGAAVL